ncbi:MAG: KPN_02809 family neutral zinc metallopeptidase [Nocardioidaceae bacterium]
MKFNPRARLDPSQVRDRRGTPSTGGGLSGGFRGGRLPVGGAAGGGIGTVVVLVIVFFIYQGVSGGSSSPTDAGLPNDTNLSAECTTGQDANTNSDCAKVAEVNSIQSYWTSALPQLAGVDYSPAQTEFFTASTTTMCGDATSATGPFYCPVDDTVYIDLSFFHDMLQGQLGARGGEFAEAYVLAHEYGHHIQDLLGTMSKVRTQQGATSDSVRLELQADCYGGMWGRAATSTTDTAGVAIISELTQDDIARAIDAAQAVGDDRIQQESGGRIDPDQWTHGSAAEREHWFMTGYQQGSLQACDTFSASSL